MNRFSTTTATRAASAALFIATAFAGWQLAGDRPAAADAATVVPSTKSSARPTRTLRHYGPSEQAKARLREIHAAGSPAERLRATAALVDSLSIDALAEWLDDRWFDRREGFELTLFNKLAKERWSREDPEGYLAWTIRDGSGDGSGVFAGWAENDPQRLLGFFKDHPDTRRELSALAQIAKSDPALALERYREMVETGEAGGPNDYYSQQFLRDLAVSSPAALEAALDGLPDNLRDQAEGALIAERLKTDFDSEIRKLWDRPNGWKIFEASMNGSNSADIGDKILSQLDDLPASWKSSLSNIHYRIISDQNASTWLALDYEGHGFTDQQAKQIQSYAIQRLSARDPAAALGALDGLEMNDNLRENVLRNIFLRHAGDEAKTAELMALLGSDADHAIVQKALESRGGDDPFGDGSPREKIETPEQWIEKAGAIDLQSGNGYQMAYVLREWTREQIAELGTQFQSMPEENKHAVASILASDYGANHGAIDPGLRGEAIHYLVANPAPQEGQNEQQAARNAASLTSRHAVKWGLNDPVAASEWTSTLPAGDARLWAQKNLAANWAGYDPAAAQQWVNSLPAAEREAVDDFMKAPPHR